MRSSRPAAGTWSRNPAVAGGLSLISGGATAAVAAYYAPSAWSSYQACGAGGGGSGCPSHPFWGFSAELYLVACLVGILVGAVTAAAGGFASRGAVHPRFAGSFLVALSVVGLLAYGGFGIGAVCGVLAGVILRRSRSTRALPPPEWSGSLPPGVPPAPRSAKRAVPERPSVSEWDGAFEPSLITPAEAPPARPVPPTADRVAEALERSRLPPPYPGAPGATSPTVVLPPPPLGLRTMYTAPPHGGTSGGSTGPLPPPPPKASPALPTELSEPRPLPKTPRWRPAATDLTPWTEPAGPPGTAPTGWPRTAPSPASAPSASAPGTEPLPPPRPAPPRATPAGLMPAARAPARPPLTAPTAAPSRPVARPPAQSPGPGPAGVFPTPASAGRAAPPPWKSAPPSSVRPPPPPPVPTVVAPGPSDGGSVPADRPPPPTERLPRQLSRAWRCPNCKLINAPWSTRCTRCKTIIQVT